MMTQAFYTGISGLKNSSTGIDVVSNNIANINTVGYRSYTTEFSNLFEDAISTGTVFNENIGVGVQVQTTSMVQEQGALAISDRSTDLAILGEGWFSVTGTGQNLYTRDGGFSFDSNNNLVTADGLYLLGTKGGNISKDNVLTAKIGELDLGDIANQEKLSFPNTLTFPPVASTKVKFLANVGVDYEPVTAGSAVVDVNAPEELNVTSPTCVS